MPRFVVELEEDDLLPRPQSRAAVDNREGKAWSEERGADMAVAVSVAPPALVPVLDRRREEPIQRLRDVLFHETRFELVGDDRTRRRCREHAGKTVPDTGFFDRLRNAFRDIDRLDPSVGLEWNRLVVSEHGTGISSARKKVRGPNQSTLFKVSFRRSASPSRERKRSRGPLPALRRRSPEALAGGRWLGGGLLSVSAEADETVVVEGDRPHVPGRLDRLRRLHLDMDRVVVLLLDLLRRVLDLLGEGREVRLGQMVDDALDDRDDHVANDLHRFVEGHLVGEPVQRIVLHDNHAVRLATELLETLSGGFRPTLDLERQDRNADRDGPVRARGPSDNGRGPGPRGAAESRDDEDDVGGERVPQGAFLVFRGRTGPGDPVFFRGRSEQDLHVALGLREPGGIRVHRDRFDALDVAVVQRAYHLPARPPDSDDRDFRVHGVLKQAADDFFDVIPGYHSSASTHPATDRARPEGSSLR